MATNLGDLVKGYLTPDVLQRAASFVGGSPTGTQNALAAGVPAVLGALAEMGSTRTGVDQIVRMLDAGKFDGSALNSTVTTTRFVFAHINFETGSATITPGSVQTLGGMASILKCYPAARIELDGYTDSTGNPEANQKLSVDRANAVKDLLVKNGVEESRISTKGFGETHPLASNATAAGRAENRRTEMVVER